MNILIKFIAFIFIMTIWNMSLALAEMPEEKGLRLAIEADLTGKGFKDTVSKMQMTLRNAQGEESVRKFYSKTLEMENDGDKSIFIFQQPKDVDGTAVLTFTHKSGPDDQWLYLPALKRVKRISSDNKSGSFVGSEFAYEDLSSQEVEKYTYKWIEDAPCPGDEEEKCYVSESYPEDKSSGYTRRVSWVDISEHRVRKIDFYDRKDTLLKTLVFSDYKQYLGKYWSAHSLKMVNHNTNKETDIEVSEIVYQSGLKDSDFNRQSLKRAR
jgi:hypothetical protein